MDIIIGEEIKQNMLLTCIPVLKKYLLEERDKNTPKMKPILDKALYVLNQIENKKNITTFEVSYLILALSSKFIEIEQSIKSGTPNNISKINSPSYWEEGYIHLDVAVFFSFTYLVEKYKDVLELLPSLEM